MDDDIKEINDSLKAVGDQLKAAAERAAKNVEMNAETRAKVDELLTAQGALQANLQSAEQKLAMLEANGAGGDVQRITLGARFTDDEKVKAFLGEATPRGRVDITMHNAITSVTTNTDGAAGALVAPDRQTQVISAPQRRMTVRDLLTPGQTDSNTVEYVKETGFTNAAAPVAEGAKKPESSLKYALVTTPVRVIAHTMKASRQILSDASQLMSTIDGKMRYGLAFVEENQLLNGDGTGQNLNGIVPQASAYTPVANDTVIDSVRRALLQAELAEYPSTGIVLHPTDWAAVEMLKDTQGRYIIGNPQGTIAATLWSRPVVTTQAMASGKFLVGAFRLGAQIFDRWLSRVEIATENEDDFVKNMVTILAEERLALAVYRPEAFTYGNLAV